MTLLCAAGGPQGRGVEGKTGEIKGFGGEETTEVIRRAEVQRWTQESHEEQERAE